MNRLALTFVALMVGGAALAQPPQGGEQGGGFGGRGGGRGGRGGGQGGPGGGFGGQGGGFPGGGGFGGMMGGMMGGMGGPGGMMGMMGMNREISAANVALRIMALYLSLTDAQSGKIALIREESQDAMRPQMPPRRPQQDPNADPNAAQNAQGGGRPDMQAMMQEMQAAMQEMQANIAKAERKATTDTDAVLSEAQRTRLKLLIKALKGLQEAGIRPEATLKLMLNEDQLTKLAQGRKPESVLSTEQQTIAKGYTMPMGRGGQGGPGGGFGGRGGGQGGPGGGG
ncbi:MAG: hypothetical protein NTX57_19715 [Armatimonadetes bacterium]|nr:hypothetical protein [Armatimonadota bacterium]